MTHDPDLTLQTSAEPQDLLDRLLAMPALAPPADFAQRVMQRIDHFERLSASTRLPERSPARPPAHLPTGSSASRWPRLQQLSAAMAIAGASVLGLSQLLTFIFGVWLAGTAL